MSENETAVIRWNYGDPSLGACKETIEGGNHFRYWVQNGKSANRCAPSVTFLMGTLIILWTNSGAVFMAESYEMPIAQQHDIVPNGYLLPTPHSLSLLIPLPQIQPWPRLASRQRNKPNQFDSHPVPHKHINNIWFKILRRIHLPYKCNIRFGTSTEYECGDQPQWQCSCAGR